MMRRVISLVVFRRGHSIWSDGLGEARIWSDGSGKARIWPNGRCRFPNYSILAVGGKRGEGAVYPSLVMSCVV